MDKKKIAIILVAVLVLIIAIVCVCMYLNAKANESKPEDVFNAYMSYLINGEYENMYELLDENSKANTSLDVFVSRNKNIYTGIEAKNIKITNVRVEETENGMVRIMYDTSMDTMAGEITFSNNMILSLNAEKLYKISWSSKLIYPDLREEDRVRVGRTEPKRGKIYDRNNVIIAEEGIISSVGFVPGKMTERSDLKAADIKKTAELLEMSEEKINTLLNASYVKSDTFVAIANVAKNNMELKEKLLQIPGIKITDATARVYHYGEQTAHLIGYVQNVTAEDLEENPDKGYTKNSVIGKAGIEKIYEDRLKGNSGSEIYITDSQGNRIQTIAKIDVKNGEDIKLTIDVRIQRIAYEQFSEDKSAVVVIEPKTGEILALCSTPTYDSNDFILGMSDTKWQGIVNNQSKPLYNRYAASFAPGSSFKPIIAGIGLTNNKFTFDEDFGTSGKAWQKDSSWGTYNVTTLATYDGKADLKNALIYSDNIYFAKAALKIGKDTLAKELDRIGFNKEIEFVQNIAASKYSNSNTFQSDIQLADSGYGQGQVLVNPIHVASIYSAFVNDGNMIKPYLEYKESAKGEVYVENAFTKEAANEIKEDLIQVVENPNGTASSAKINGVKLAGKTGTAEIKASQEDTSGTEIGWFNAFIADEASNRQLLVVSMVEDVKNRGGSHYLLPKVKNIIQTTINL